MKTNYFDLKFWQNHLLAFLSSALLIIFFSLQTAAQPGDCISMNWRGCEKQREELLQKYAAEISALDQQIRREPKNAELYYWRGKIYSAMMFEKNLGFKTVEFDGRVYFSEIDTKAVADYTQAINLAPKAAYFKERGIIYRAYWEKETSPFNSDKMSKEEILEAVERLFLENANFKAAERDFQKAFELSDDGEAFRITRGKLPYLRWSRAFILGNYDNTAAAIGSGKAAEIALADMDYFIGYHKNLYARNKNSWEKNSIYTSLIEKGRMARKFGRDTLALEVFNEAGKYWNNGEPDCFVYEYRASIFLKRGEIDAALRQLTQAIGDGNWNCRPLRQFRGDIYFRQGEWQSAILDYTTFINIEQGKYSKDTYLKRGKAYLKINEAEKAAADFKYVIEDLFNTTCPQYFLLRAEAYKLAGKTDLAGADERKAGAMPKNRKYESCVINFLE